MYLKLIASWFLFSFFFGGVVVGGFTKSLNNHKVANSWHNMFQFKQIGEAKSSNLLVMQRTVITCDVCEGPWPTQLLK